MVTMLEKPQRKEKPFSTGHMPEITMRHVRSGTDSVMRDIIPWLSEELVRGELTLENFMYLRQPYFGTRPELASMFGGLAQFTATNAALYPRNLYKNTKRSLAKEVGGISVREENVYGGSGFDHPSSENLPYLGEILVHQMNEFIAISQEIPMNYIHPLLYKFYMLVSVLHLPMDGSGRFTGDSNSLLQNALKAKFSQYGLRFKPGYISNNGYRLGGAENRVGTAQYSYRYYLLMDIARDLKNNAIVAGIKKWYSGLQDVYVPMNVTDLVENHITELKTFGDKNWNYYLSKELESQIRGIFDFSKPTWFNNLALSNIPSDMFGFDSYKYNFSEDFDPYHIETLDLLAGVCHSGELELLTQLLTSPSSLPRDLVATRVNKRIIHDILCSLHVSDSDSYRIVMSENPGLRGIVKKQDLLSKFVI